MKGIIKAKWFIVLAWIAAVAVLMVTAPNMAELVRDKGQIQIADDYSSSIAEEFIHEINEQKGKGDTTTLALVFHRESGLTDADFAEAEKAIGRLKQQREQLGIAEILTHFDQEKLKDQLLSQDGKTILASVTVEWNNRTAQELSDDLYAAIGDMKLEHYYTGGALITEDVVQTTEAGVKKTEAITVVFILVVLIAVFRSVVAPFIPLITVGISYLASQSIVAYLVQYLDFPLSNFTQIFLVAVLFGIGTDYSILLLNRFKEELISQDDVTGAIAATYKTAGKTVFFSGVAVLIGFAVLGLSQFNIYQSAVAVAVGIAALLLALFTVFPFFMAVLGKKIFWPAKGSLQHHPSRLWHAAGRFAFAKPVYALVIVAVIAIPFIVTYNKQLSYNSVNEIGADYNSVKGYEVIEKSFGPGEALSTKILLKNDEEMDRIEYLTIMEEIGQELDQVAGVDQVRSLTRPTGEILEDLQIANQAETLKDGINEGNEGIKQIRDGLADAESRLTSSAPKLGEAEDGIASLANGTSRLKSGLAELQDGLRQIESGVRNGSMGAADAAAGLAEIKKNAETLLAGCKQLAGSYDEIAAQLSTMDANYAQIEEGLTALNGQLAELEQSFAYLGGYLQNQPASQEQQTALQSFQGIQAYFSALQQNLPGLSSGLSELNAGLSSLAQGMNTANQNFAALNDGQEQLIAGMQRLIDGMGELQQGLAAAADAQGTVIGKLPEVSDGLGAIHEGQQELLTGFADIENQLNRLTDGLGEGVDGLTEIHEGLADAEGYLTELADPKRQSDVYIPEEILEEEEYGPVLDTYLSPDRKIATIDVILRENPYSIEALDQIGEIRAAVERAVQGTKLENADMAIGGVTSEFNDLRTISGQDFNRTLIFMLIGIGLILMIQFRSLIMPIYLVASLLITYFTTMGVTEFIFVNLLGYDGINWAVPFFSFVLLMALGVDYSIFLMGRFNEHRGEPIETSMIKSMSNMGTVIISAAVILGGTFAAMLPSGVQTLLQISTIVILGLILYSFIVLPLFVPVMVKIFGKANWWPFMQEDQKH